jgi:hypothetical protein
MVATSPELYLESCTNALIALKDSDAIATVVFGGRFSLTKVGQLTAIPILRLIFFW